MYCLSFVYCHFCIVWCSRLRTKHDLVDCGRNLISDSRKEAEAGDERAVESKQVVYVSRRYLALQYDVRSTNFERPGKMLVFSPIPSHTY
jgi:hypothetical protein